jgi:2-keto-4-pentenoate hydratase
MKRLVLAGLIMGCAVGPAAAAEACRPDPRIDTVVADWLAKRPQPVREIGTGQGTCFRQQLIAKLMPTLGPVVGYKVGAYTKAGQAVYNTDKPVIAILLKGMMLPEGKPVLASYGVTPLWEADFLLVVKDDGINTARTREEAYRSLRGYQPFIELADRGYAAGSVINLDQWKALNVSGRHGMAGKEVPLPQTRAGLDALAALTVEAEVVGPTGTSSRSAVARESLGDPVEVVLAARDLLRDEGLSLKAGDIISLGSLIPATPVKAGETVTVRYKVLTGTDVITARFE